MGADFKLEVDQVHPDPRSPEYATLERSWVKVAPGVFGNGVELITKAGRGAVRLELTCEQALALAGALEARALEARARGL